MVSNPAGAAVELIEPRHCGRLAILTSHPVQYYAPLFRTLARSVDLHVFFAHQASASDQAAAGFGKQFSWDIDLTSGYNHSFLNNVAPVPSASRFRGCDTPDIGRHLEAGGFTHVLSMGWHLKALIQGIWAAKRQDRRVFIRGDSQLGTQRGALKKAVKALTYPHLLRQFDAALYVGQNNKAYYRHYGVPERRLFHSPHAVDTERFRHGATDQARAALRTRLAVPATQKLVLFAGKLVEFKRPLDVVEMVLRIRRDGIDAALLVAGSGPLENAMRAGAADAGVPTHFLGFQNQSEMPAVYAAADVLVLPSTARETWGLVTNEALASGTPILVSDAVGCAPDLTANQCAGRDFPLGDIDSAAALLATILNDPPSRSAIADASERHSLRAAALGVIAAMTAIPPNNCPPNAGAALGLKSVRR